MEEKKQRLIYQYERMKGVIKMIMQDIKKKREQMKNGGVKLAENFSENMKSLWKRVVKDFGQKG